MILRRLGHYRENDVSFIPGDPDNAILFLIDPVARFVEFSQTTAYRG
jgi:hypothetical protein